jgi:hypothetical protein
MTHRLKPILQPPLLVSVAHNNALTSRLHVIEDECREIMRYLDGYHGIFSEYVGEVPPAAKQAARSVLMEIVEALLAIKRDLALSKRQIDLHRVFNAHLSHIWVTLHECKGESLRGHGAVPEDLQAYLELRIDELLGLLRSLRSLLEPPPEQTSRPNGTGGSE